MYSLAAASLFITPFALLIGVTLLLWAAARAFARGRPAPGAWVAVLHVHWPLLLGVHLLIFSAMLFGTRLVTLQNDQVVRAADWHATGLLYSDWTTKFWIGPFVVIVACAALILLLVTALSSRWALWRGDIILFAGLLIGGATLMFHASPIVNHLLGISNTDYAAREMPSNAIRIITPEGTWVTRAHQNGVMIDWFCVVLLIAGGAVMMKEALGQSTGPRFSRLALWVAIGPPMAFIAFLGVIILVAIVGRGEYDRGPEAELCILGWLFVFGYPIAATILGWIAVYRIKRSNGRLRGLRLAAVEATLFPMIFVFILVSQGVFWLLFGLLMLIAPHQVFPYAHSDRRPSPVVVVPLILVALSAAVVVWIYLGRAVWPAIVGRKAASSTPNARPRTKGVYWRISQFPELKHLDPFQRADVLGAVPWWTYPVIIVRAGLVAYGAAVILGILFGHLADHNVILLFLILILIGTVVWIAIYLLQLSRVRGLIRSEIAKAFRGQNPPFCFTCGCDLRGATGTTCPACGSVTGASGIRKKGSAARP